MEGSNLSPACHPGLNAPGGHENHSGLTCGPRSPQSTCRLQGWSTRPAQSMGSLQGCSTRPYCMSESVLRMRCVSDSSPSGVGMWMSRSRYRIRSTGHTIQAVPAPNISSTCRQGRHRHTRPKTRAIGRHRHTAENAGNREGTLGALQLTNIHHFKLDLQLHKCGPEIRSCKNTTNPGHSQ